MTARRQFKRRVRARAEKTGEPYMVARRQLEHRSGQERPMPETTSITDDRNGFSITLPEGWRQVEPHVTASHWQVATFDGREEGAHRYAALLVLPANDKSIEEIVANAAATYTKSGVADVTVEEVSFAERPGRRIEGSLDTRGTTIRVVEHIVVEGDRVYRLAVRSDDIARDRADLDTLVTTFRLRPPTAALKTPGSGAPLTDRALRVVRIADRLAAELGHDAPTGAHLLYGLAAESDGVAGVVVSQAGITASQIRDAVAAVAPSETPAMPPSHKLEHIARRVAPTLATELGHYFVGTEHLLLAVLRDDNDGRALLLTLGLDPAVARAAIASILTASLEERITGGAS